MEDWIKETSFNAMLIHVVLIRLFLLSFHSKTFIHTYRLYIHVNSHIFILMLSYQIWFEYKLWKVLQYKLKKNISSITGNIVFNIKRTEKKIEWLTNLVFSLDGKFHNQFLGVFTNKHKRRCWFTLWKLQSDSEWKSKLGFL